MFEDLTKKLGDVFAKLSQAGKLRESNIEEAIRDVRLSLLEADVNYKVVLRIVENIKSEALGQRVLESLSPYQQFIGIVNRELIRIFESGEKDSELSFEPSGITRVMLVGLQGSGKTTTAGKLANFIYRKHGFKPLLVPLDTKRAAAIEQLKVIGAGLDIPVFALGSDNPLNIAKEALEHAREHSFKLVIFDTAGRLHIDEGLMDELAALKRELSPKEILFVADAMTGQDAVNMAKGFNDRLGITGIILTKMDGDARGGAALSIVSVVGRPIKFIGVGEKPDAFDPFHPERAVSRILGMGDIVTLFEKTKDAVEEEEIIRLAQKVKKKDFTIMDFLGQLKQIKKLGSLESIIELIPGVSKLLKTKDLHMAEGEFKKIEAMINSMTDQERENHAIMNGRRRLRIALGSGTTVQDLNRFLKQFMQTRKMIQRMGSLSPKDLFKKRFF